MADLESNRLDGVEISERSKKFYAGHYRYDECGFEDESGGMIESFYLQLGSVVANSKTVYRRWGDTPSQAPPTPNPPRPLSDSGIDKGSEDVSVESPPSMRMYHAPLEPSYLWLPPNVDPSVPHPALSPHIVSSFTQYTPRPQPEPLPTNFNEERANRPGATYPKTLLKEDLFADQPEPERQHSLGLMKGMLIGMWHSGAGVSLEEAHELVGVPYEDGMIRAAASLTAMANGEVNGKLLLCRCRESYR